VDTAPLIINGTITLSLSSTKAFALNAANGNVLWTTVLPVTPNSTAGRVLAQSRCTSTTETNSSQRNCLATLQHGGFRLTT